MRRNFKEMVDSIYHNGVPVPTNYFEPVRPESVITTTSPWGNVASYQSPWINSFLPTLNVDNDNSEDIEINVAGISIERMEVGSEKLPDGSNKITLIVAADKDSNYLPFGHMQEFEFKSCVDPESLTCHLSEGILTLSGLKDRTFKPQIRVIPISG